MLSEEEKAIQFYKRFIEVEEQELEWMYKEDEEYYRDSIEQKELLIKGWRNILNLITKLQKENEDLKKAINVVEKEKGQWIEENEEKDKQIELMIEEYEYNARINFKNFCEDELRKDKCIQDCKTCAKKYFETKAKKGE